ncbi:MAG TPA: DUF1614 domain-containing protein [Thiobacillaceae bacterium]|nr:DUF1614 domain-containing protein [Thiobacillaceae bacterium]
MLTSGLHYFPITLPFLFLLAALFGLVFGLVASSVLHYASASMGIKSSSVFIILLLSLLWSYVNIPIAYFPERHMTAAAEVSYFGIHYVIPVIREWPATVIAINVGGAVIPILISIYLMQKNRLFGLSLIGVGVVAAICHLLAYPVPGLGIAVPIIVPPLATALVALALSRRYAAPLAYICGSLGTLIGADLLNLGKIQGLGAPIASIGGAGTFDGIFLTGLLAVLYAGLVTRGEARAG